MLSQTKTYAEQPVKSMEDLCGVKRKENENTEIENEFLLFRLKAQYLEILLTRLEHHFLFSPSPKSLGKYTFFFDMH